MTEPRRRLHHFLPVFHLSNFSDESGKVWCYDKAAEFEPQQLPVRKVGAEKYLYAPEIGPDPLDDSFEKWIAGDIDGPAARAIRNILEGRDLNQRDYSRLAAYIGFLDMRTPSFQRLYMTMAQAHMDQEWERIVGDRVSLLEQLRKDGAEITMEELEAELTQYAGVEVNKPSWLGFLQQTVNRAGELVYRMGWRLIAAPTGIDFVANDIGIVKFLDHFGQPVHRTPGFGAGRLHWLVPLASQYALAISSAYGGETVEGRPNWIRTVNRQIVIDAERFVYSKRYHSFIVRMMDIIVKRHAALEK